MLIQDDLIKKESSVDNRIARGLQNIGAGGVVLDIINTSQNDNILIDTPEAKNYIQYEPS